MTTRRRAASGTVRTRRNLAWPGLRPSAGGRDVACEAKRPEPARHSTQFVRDGTRKPVPGSSPKPSADDTVASEAIQVDAAHETGDVAVSEAELEDRSPAVWRSQALRLRSAVDERAEGAEERPIDECAALVPVAEAEIPGREILCRGRRDRDEHEHRDGCDRDSSHARSTYAVRLRFRRLVSSGRGRR
jgi:hypothetical protein